MATPTHTHFCSQCYGPAKRRRTDRKEPLGWWRCTDKPCVREMAATCQRHTPQRAPRHFVGV
jgi:hypothetical protein